MKRKHDVIIGLLIILVSVIGCAPVKKTVKVVWGLSNETAKEMWGSSTRALEKARANSIIKTYRCELNDCFDAVLSLARKTTTTNLQSYSEGHTIQDPQAAAPQDTATAPIGLGPLEEGENVRTQQTSDFFEVFKKDRKKGYLVVIGIKGSVDTTEAGIFFSTYSPGVTKIEISSLSSNAKRHLAQDIFGQLDLKFETAL